MKSPKHAIRRLQVGITGQIVRCKGGSRGCLWWPTSRCSCLVLKDGVLQDPLTWSLGTYAKFPDGMAEIISRLHFGGLVWEIMLFKVGWKCFNHCLWGDGLKEGGYKAYSHFHSNGSIGRGESAAEGGPGRGVCGGAGRRGPTAAGCHG